MLTQKRADRRRQALLEMRDRSRQAHAMMRGDGAVPRCCHTRGRHEGWLQTTGAGALSCETDRSDQDQQKGSWRDWRWQASVDMRDRSRHTHRCGKMLQHLDGAPAGNNTGGGQVQ